ncbi:MAG: PIN domain-containing protein [Deltaproteobacteria bacterium]|nr:PIN domain-containing protein [Deltaproteobacteria bacterium]
MRLFLDANVLFTAAHNPQGKAAFVIEMAGESGWELVTSELAVEEARRNLDRKFPDCLPRFDSILRMIKRHSPAPSYDCPIPLPEKDRPILSAAISSGATHLLTGDRKHFGPYMNTPERTAGVSIQSVADFLRSLDI